MEIRKIAILQPPSPPFMNVKRDLAGGFAVADPSTRSTYGHDEKYITLPNMSLVYTTAVLEKEGFGIAYIDGQVERLDPDRLLERLKKENSQVLISLLNLPSIYGDLELLKIVKKAMPQLVIMAMGTVAIPLYSLIAGSKAVDVIIRGDAEEALPKLMKNRRLLEAVCSGRSLDDREALDGFEVREGAWTNREIARIKDLDNYPELPFHLMPVSKYWYHVFGKNVRYASVFSSRGCSFRCYYCPYPIGFGDTIVYRDPVKVVDEIERLQKGYGITAVLFRDQVFTMDGARTERLCDEILRRGLKIEWVVETRLDKVNKKLLRKMKQAGCKRMHYGIESGDPKVFKAVGKDGAEGRMEELIRNFTLTEKVGIAPHMFVLIGLMGETWESIHKTIALVKRMKPPTLQVSVVTPYPGTPLFDEVRKKGLLLTEDWSEYTGFKPVMRTEALSGEDLLAARKLIIAEHRKAVFWKLQLHKMKLLVRYSLDGSIFRRLKKRRI